MVVKNSDNLKNIAIRPVLNNDYRPREWTHINDTECAIAEMMCSCFEFCAVLVHVYCLSFVLANLYSCSLKEKNSIKILINKKKNLKLSTTTEKVHREIVFFFIIWAL